LYTIFGKIATKKGTREEKASPKGRAFQGKSSTPSKTLKISFSALEKKHKI